jgi:hypothetical protein
MLIERSFQAMTIVFYRTLMVAYLVASDELVNFFVEMSLVWAAQDTPVSVLIVVGVSQLLVLSPECRVSEPLWENLQRQRNKIQFIGFSNK